MKTNSHTILVVDDNIELSHILEYALTDNGFNVITAGNGADALEYLMNWAIDLVILDLKLPDMEGEVVLRKIKQLRPRTKVIIMTGYGDVESYVHTAQTGATDYLIKPASLKELLCVIEKSFQLTK